MIICKTIDEVNDICSTGVGKGSLIFAKIVNTRDLKIGRRDELGRLLEVNLLNPGMRTRTLDLSLRRPRLVDDVISPV